MATAQIFPTFEINPALKKAIDRWTETTKNTVEEISLIENAITPLQTLMQTSSNSFSYLSKLDWPKLLRASTKPSALQEVMENFTEMQKSALKRISNDQQELFETVANDSKALVNANTSIANPQEAAANFINKSLDALENIKTSLENQAQTSASIQAAVNAWYQQSLTTLSKK